MGIYFFSLRNDVIYYICIKFVQTFDKRTDIIYLILLHMRKINIKYYL